MGCFSILKPKKKRNLPVGYKHGTDARETTSAMLPEPESSGPSLQSAPPSFRNRTNTAQTANKLSISRTRTLSAPSSLVVDQYTLSSVEYDDQEGSRGRLSMKEHRISDPKPLPLPSPDLIFNPRNAGSFKASSGSGPIATSGPLPLPPSGSRGLRNFSFEEVLSACQHFSRELHISECGSFFTKVYDATLRDDASGSKKIDATMVRLHSSGQAYRNFVYEVNILASFHHPNLCKLIGFHRQEGSSELILVYERLHHGSLDGLLYGRSDGPSMDWPTRMKVALCVARGLAFLHDEGPFQAMYNEFSPADIQIDKDFVAKLSGYGCVSYHSQAEIPDSAFAAAYLSVETVEKGILTPKSNVWSFGIVLLEMITGRKNFDARHPKEERNIIKWSRPFLTDDCRLPLILDPRLKGRFPPKAARTVADIILKCLHKDPSERPTMRAIVDQLASVHDLKQPCRHPLQEPSAVGGGVIGGKRVMLKSTSFNGIALQQPVTSFLPSPPLSRSQILVSPRKLPTAAQLPPRTCALTVTMVPVLDPGVPSATKIV